MYNLVHLTDKSIDFVFTVSEITSLDEMSELSWAETTGRVAELEGPEKVGSLLEVGANSEDLVDQIFHADNAILTKGVLYDGVVGEGDTLLVNLSISTLVDEFTNGFEVGISVGDPWLNDLQHLEGGFSHANEDTVVDLEKSEELEDLAGLWCNLVDTLDTDNEDQLLLSRNVEGIILLGNTSKTDLLTLGITVLLHIFLGAVEDDTTLLLLGLLLLLELGRSLLSGLLLALAFLEKSLRDEDLILGGDAPVWKISLVSRIRSMEKRA